MMIKSISWAFFTIFSVIGYLGIVEIFPSISGNDEIGFIITIINFFISNLIAAFCVRGLLVSTVNLFLIGLGILVFVFSLEVYLVWLLCDALFTSFASFWGITFFLILLFIVLYYGGIRQILQIILYIISEMINGSTVNIVSAWYGTNPNSPKQKKKKN